MSKEEKLKELMQLKENEFKNDVILPLFRKIRSIKYVQDRHGNDESGIDVAYFEEDSLGTLGMIGVQLKVGDISNTPSSPNKNDITTLSTQIRAAFDRKHDFVEPRGKFQPKSMYVITNSKISNSAKKQIVDGVGVHNQINFLTGENVLNLIEQHYPDYFIIKDKKYIDYYKSIYMKYNDFSDLKKFGTVKDKSLDDVFIEPDLVEYDEDNLQNYRATERKKKYTCHDILSTNGKILIIGEQGIGKTTLLKALLCMQIKSNLDDKEKGKIPVFIKVKDLIQCDFDILKAIEYILSNNEGERVLLELEKDLKDGNYILLIDSYNEIFSEVQLEDFEKNLDNFIKQNPNNSIILTSRKYKMTLNEKFPDFLKIEIQEFSHNKLNLFVKKWYKNSEALPDVAFNAVERKISIGHFPRTPFVYTICMVLYENNREEITSNVAELFEKYIELYLGKWDKELGVSNNFDYKTKSDYLCFIAYFMHKNNLNVIDKRTFIELINEKFDNVGLDQEGRLLLEEIIKTGIVREIDNKIEFAFFTLLEFFCAKHILLNNLEVELLENYFDTRWTYVLIYYSGLKRECDKIINKILKDEIIDSDSNYKIFYQTFILGTILQNADQSTKNIKLNSISYCLNNLIDLYNKLIDEKINKGEIKDSTIVLLFIDALSDYILSSPKLKNQYYDLFYCCEDREKEEIWKFLITSLISNLALDGYVNYLNETLKSQNFDVLLAILIKTKMFMVDRKSSINYVQLKNIEKKVTNRLRSSNKKIKTEYKSLLS